MLAMTHTTLRYLNADDADLGEIAHALNASESELSVKEFTASTLKDFLSQPQAFYLIATHADKLVGAAHGYGHLHPAGPKYLYVDEVDTVEQYRRQGIASALMKSIFAYAKNQHYNEVWLGADNGNDPAFRLYESLEPTEREPGVIFSWKI